MTERISKNLYIEVNDPEEEFSIIGSGEELFYDPSPIDEHLFISQNYYYKDTSSRQKYFFLETYTLQDYFELLGHLCVAGYDKRIRQLVPDVLKDSYDNSSKVKKKVLWTLNKIKANPEEFLKYKSHNYLCRHALGIEVLIDYNKLDDWRNFLKNVPGYKVEWLYVDRQPSRAEYSDYILR